jgi:hypothetical protein
LPYVRSPDWRASSSHASASSNSVCLACASGIRATISRHARAYSINLAGSSTISGFRRLTGPEIGHDDLGQAIGIALARQAQVDDLGHEDFRRGIRRGNSPAPHRPCRRQPAWPGCVQVQIFGTATASWLSTTKLRHGTCSGFPNLCSEVTQLAQAVRALVNIATQKK